MMLPHKKREDKMLSKHVLRSRVCYGLPAYLTRTKTRQNISKGDVATFSVDPVGIKLCSKHSTNKNVDLPSLCELLSKITSGNYGGKVMPAIQLFCN